jgi:hypothetical protein
VTCVRADFLPGEDDTDIPESRNGVPDLLDEARWGLEWLLAIWPVVLLARRIVKPAARLLDRCLGDPVGAAADCEQVLANVHHMLGRNYQQMAYVSRLPGVTRGRTHAFHHWLAALDAKPFLFPGLLAGGPIAAPEAGDVAVPHGRPIPIWGYWGDPAMPRDATTPLEGRYTDNDSWSTNELDVDWQGVTLYNLYLARWWAAGAPVTPATVSPSGPGFTSKSNP